MFGLVVGWRINLRCKNHRPNTATHGSESHPSPPPHPLIHSQTQHHPRTFPPSLPPRTSSSEIPSDPSSSPSLPSGLNHSAMLSRSSVSASSGRPCSYRRLASACSGSGLDASALRARWRSAATSSATWGVGGGPAGVLLMNVLFLV